jgi:hypothetical protein
LSQPKQLRAQVVLRNNIAGKTYPHKKQTGIRVVVLGGFFDIAFAFEQKPRHGMHNARAVWA